MAQVIGFVSSFILLLTIGKQVYKQWKEGTSEGVSKWLFIGQTAASVGFLIYSLMIKDWVFIVTNSVMVLNSLAGLVICFVTAAGKINLLNKTGLFAQQIPNLQTEHRADGNRNQDQRSPPQNIIKFGVFQLAHQPPVVNEQQNEKQNHGQNRAV